ncbi:MAG: hypothetical protein ACI4LE_00120 [Faecalibacterium sp.]
MTTSPRTSGSVHWSSGAGPLPPSPVNSAWVGIWMVSSSMVRAPLVSGIISGWASVTCPGKICTPSMRTERNPGFWAVRLHTA